VIKFILIKFILIGELIKKWSYSLANPFHFSFKICYTIYKNLKMSKIFI